MGTVHHGVKPVRYWIHSVSISYLAKCYIAGELYLHYKTLPPVGNQVIEEDDDHGCSIH